MARPAKFTIDQILDAAASLVAAGGPAGVSMAAIARDVGAPTGSIYHRFDSRDLLMARLWVRTVRRAQVGFMAVLDQPDPRTAAHGAALHLLDWCRTNPTDARILLLYRREQLATLWPEELGEELAELNRPLFEALKAFSRRLTGPDTAERREAVRMALIDLPYAAGRRHLADGDTIPRTVDPLVVRACDALLFGLFDAT